MTIGLGLRVCLGSKRHVEDRLADRVRIRFSAFVANTKRIIIVDALGCCAICALAGAVQTWVGLSQRNSLIAVHILVNK